MDTLITTFKIHFTAVAALASAVCFGINGLAVVTGALVHEAGHIALAFFLGAEIREVEIKLFGISLCKDELDPLSELLIAAAGPTAGLLLSGIAAFFGNKEVFAYSLMLSLFNLIPLYPLDGYRIIRYFKIIRGKFAS